MLTSLVPTFTRLAIQVARRISQKHRKCGFGGEVYNGCSVGQGSGKGPGEVQSCRRSAHKSDAGGRA